VRWFEARNAGDLAPFYGGRRVKRDAYDENLWHGLAIGASREDCYTGIGATAAR